MQERVNKHKPLPKKEVTEKNEVDDEFGLTQSSRFLSSSQNKLFIRKPVSKSRGFVSPTFVKNQPIQNEQLITPQLQLKSKRSIPFDSKSDKDHWERQQKQQTINKYAIKRNPLNQQEIKLSQSFHNNSQAIQQAYYGNETYALTQIGQNYKVQTTVSDTSQKDLYFTQNMKKSIKQNIALNSLNANMKKATRTQYFTSNNDEIMSVTSRSLKDKQINFRQLKASANNNLESYTKSLEQNIRKLQKNTYTLTKKCKWMHEQVEMHLQKQNTINAQNKILSSQIKQKQTQISALQKELYSLKKQLTEAKADQFRKQSLVRYKSFKDIETISSLKQLGSKKQQNSLIDKKKPDQTQQGNSGNTSLSTQKNKKLSFKTYPGVRLPRNRKDDLSKSSSIVGNNDSYQELGQSSILNNKSSLKHQISIERNSLLCEELQKERDSLKAELEPIKLEMCKLKQQHNKNQQQLNEKYEKKVLSMGEEISNLRNLKNILEEQKSNLANQLDKILTAHQSQVESLNFRIKQLQTLNEGKSKSSLPSFKDLNDLQGLNPLKYILQHPLTTENSQSGLDENHFENENQSLRIYIQNILQHYKYVKIQNRMLLKVKEDLQKSEKEKKQIKDERDMFKKKLLDTIKNKNQPKNNKKHIQSDSDSDDSQSSVSAILQLSQSLIIEHPQPSIICE